MQSPVWSREGTRIRSIIIFFHRPVGLGFHAREREANAICQKKKRAWIDQIQENKKERGLIVKAPRRIQGSICPIPPKKHYSNGTLCKVGAQRQSIPLAEERYTLQAVVGERISRAGFESCIPQQAVGSIRLEARVRSTLLKEADKHIRQGGLEPWPF